MGMYGMNMNGMSPEMGMGMNYGAGGVYGGNAFDAQNQNNMMWNGGPPDKYNAMQNAAFDSRFGPGPHPGAGGGAGPGPGYRGFNYPHMQNDFSYGRGGYGRGRGFGPGRGRGYVQNSGNFPHTNIPMPQGPNGPGMPAQTNPQDAEAAEKKFSNELAPGGEEDLKEHQPKEEANEESKAGDQNEANAETSDKDTHNPPSTAPVDSETQPKGIDTVNGNGPGPFPEMSNAMPGSHDAPQFVDGMGMHDQLFHQQMDPNMAMMGMGPHMNGPHMNGPMNMPMHGFPLHGQGPMFNGPPAGRGQGVEGAPAAPRAMREGLPNTGIRHHGRYASFGGRGARSQSKGTRRYVHSTLVLKVNAI